MRAIDTTSAFDTQQVEYSAWLSSDPQDTNPLLEFLAQNGFPLQIDPNTILIMQVLALGLILGLTISSSMRTWASRELVSSTCQRDATDGLTILCAYSTGLAAAVVGAWQIIMATFAPSVMMIAIVGVSAAVTHMMPANNRQWHAAQKAATPRSHYLPQTRAGLR